MKVTKTIEGRVGVIAGMLLASSFSTHATVDIGLAENLRQALEAQGWLAEETADGSLVYRRPTDTGEIEPSQVEGRALSGEDLNRAMRQRGWRMEWDSSGNLLLRMDETPLQNQGGKKAPQEAARQVTDRFPAHSGFEYWRIERQPDGSLHFHPLEKDAMQSAATASTPTPRPCEGINLIQVDVTLPVDQWQEAHSLAQGWLDRMQLETLSVGRIRKVLGVYLVSLVRQAPPHRLAHQLAIRVTDGRVIQLN
ncbi:MAG: hypothetical protein QNJ78_11570 [Gammaproteobacteria bacterium]|nr:hypothetical protein [Gammaproteobacteria bacterium]